MSAAVCTCVLCALERKIDALEARLLGLYHDVDAKLPHPAFEGVLPRADRTEAVPAPAPKKKRAKRGHVYDTVAAFLADKKTGSFRIKDILAYAEKHGIGGVEYDSVRMQVISGKFPLTAGDLRGSYNIRGEV